MKSYRSPKTVVKRSTIEGQGLFCVDVIESSEIIGIRTGEVVDFEAMRRDREFGPFSMQVTENHFLCPSSKDDADEVGLFINHSCEPNVWLRDQIVFVARQRIEPGQELLFDYAMNLSTPYDKECNCGAASCRGRITGGDWRLDELQIRYRGHFDPVIQRKIAAEAQKEKT